MLDWRKFQPENIVSIALKLEKVGYFPDRRSCERKIGADVTNLVDAIMVTKWMYQFSGVKKTVPRKSGVERKPFLGLTPLEARPRVGASKMGARAAYVENALIVHCLTFWWQIPHCRLVSFFFLLFFFFLFFPAPSTSVSAFSRLLTLICHDVRYNWVLQFKRRVRAYTFSERFIRFLQPLLTRILANPFFTYFLVFFIG